MGENMPKPFKIDVPQATIDRILERVRTTHWPDAPEGTGQDGWAYGADLGYMKALAEHWADHYDWRKAEAELNAHPQFIARVDDIDVHFIHVKGSGAKPLPLLITHGWPGSFWEFVHVVDRLAHPERHGGKAEDGFDLVIPSMPGYGFSSKPKGPIGPRKVAAMWRKLMVDVLGYPRFFAQGGDWGSAVTSYLGLDHGDVVGGIHVTMTPMALDRHPENPTDAEREWQAKAGAYFQAECAYFLEHVTKPMTPAFALADSPIGLAAWIIEKFQSWSDVPGSLDDVFTKDQLITNVMIYAVTNTIGSSIWMYRGNFEEAGGAVVPPGVRVSVPTGVGAYPKEMASFLAPRSYAERGYNLVHWAAMPRGGHFPSLEAPDLWVDDLREFFRMLR
jgi:microsomal epoxide hydrolase